MNRISQRTTHHLRPLAAVFAIGFSLALQGCGGGNSGTGSAGTASGTTANEAAQTGGERNLAEASAARPSGVLQAAVANPSGASAVFSTAPTIDTSNPFFAPIGNGRSCASCHDLAEGLSVTPAVLQSRFIASAGTDPIFNPVDGTNSPNAPVATLAEQQMSSSMLLSKGLVRIGLPIPANAQFELANVDDPYQFASAAQLSLFRRPLPTTNLKFVDTIMWDSRETLTESGSTLCIRGVPNACFAPVAADLSNQANTAAMTHEQFLAGLTGGQIAAIVEIENTFFTAQVQDHEAGSLTTAGALGGPTALSKDNFYFGINDTFHGDYRTGARFKDAVFTVFAAWEPGTPIGKEVPNNLTTRARQAIGRGEHLFNTRPINIEGVEGFNDAAGRPVVRGTCSSCHNTPNSGTHSVPLPMNTGLAAGFLRTPDMPLYTLSNPATGQVALTTDPGYALVTGNWGDIGKFKVPSLRGLASRPPYFHNGSAPDLQHVVGFYNRRFNMGLSPQESADLVAFLQAL